MAFFIPIPGTERRSPVRQVRGAKQQSSLRVKDSSLAYGRAMGHGHFIKKYIEYLAVFAITHNTEVSSVSGCTAINDVFFGSFRDGPMRELLIAFTNSYFREWRDKIKHADIDATRERCRGFCDDCDVGWRYDDNDEDEREFICTADCDEFINDVDIRIRNDTDYQIEWLAQKLTEFYDQYHSGGTLPKLVPIFRVREDRAFHRIRKTL